MAKHNVGAKNGFWKGGRTVASNGYVLVRVGTDHHLADVRGYVYEHRLIAEQKIGRHLRAGAGHNHQPAPSREAFLLALADGPRAVRELVAVLNGSPSAVRGLASKLATRGVVQRVSHGRYALAAEPRQTDREVTHA